MLWQRPHPRGTRTDDAVPDTELGVAAVLLGVVVLLATIIVPLIG